MRRVRSLCMIGFLSLAFASAKAQTMSFGSVNVGTAAPVQTLTYNFSSATTLSAVSILTTGAAGLDYTDGGGSTCATGTPYSAGQSCVVTVAFTPSAPGLRCGGVTLFAQSSTLPLMTWYLNGIGQSGAVTIDPGTQSAIATLSSNGQAYGSAIDGAGNVYVVDHANSQVIQLAAGTFTPRTVVASDGLSSPTAVALDGAGNLYISDTGNGRVIMVPNEQGTLNSADWLIVSIGGLGSPLGLATDGSGNLYVVDAANSDVVEVPASGGAPLTVASGLTSPYGVAVDAAGNVYVTSVNQVSEYPAGGGTQPIPLGSGYNNPSAVAVDASGAVYVADTGNAQIVRVAPGGASQVALALTGLSGLQGVAVDAADNLYVTSGGNVYEVNRTQAAALAFGNTSVGLTSVPQTLTVSDAGNQPLTVASLAIPANFAQVPSGGTDCAANTQLSFSGQCLIAVALAPTISGTLTGTLTLTDNALNVAASKQTVQLAGSGVQVAQTITFPTVPSPTYGAGSITLNGSASSGLSVSYTVISGPASVSGNLLTITAVGSVTVQASQAGNASYTPATPVSQTFTVNPATTTVVWSNPAAISYGTPLSATQLIATATPVGAGTYVYNPAAGTVLNAGSQILSVQFTPSNSNYAPSAGSVTLQVSQVSQTLKFTQKAPATAPYTSSFTVAATATSGLPVLFSSSGACTNAGATFTMGSSAGTCTVTASQPGNANYLTAATVTETTTASAKAAQTVTFTGAPVTAPYQSTFTVAATSNSGITPSITATGACSIGGATVTMKIGTGTCTMTATWAANTFYLAASATQTTTATKATPTVTFTGAPATAPFQSTFTVATTSNAGVTPLITATGSCTISGTVVTIKSSTGTCTSTAKWATNNSYLAAAATQVTTAQLQASVITWSAPAPITYPTPLSTTQLNAKANVPGTFVYTPKAGTVLTTGNQTLSVNFTPTGTNYAPSTGSVTLTVAAALAITSANSTAFAIGKLGSFTVTTTGNPTPALIETGSLPAGVTFTNNGDGTGTLQGTPTATTNGVFNISFTAQNGASANVVQSFTLTVTQVSAMAAARFLEQSSWGPTSTTIVQVQQAGLQSSLQQQFSAPVSSYPTPISGQTLSVVQQQFFVNATQGQDQLRQRVSFALSEIMVVSAAKGTIYPPDFSLWMNMLQNDAFGNFYTLLHDVTLSPSMGYYLDMANNNGCKTCRPNENYAREVLQLFSIGVVQLNPDGTPQIDSNGDPIPTYTQDTIDGFAQVFTGWSYPPVAGKNAAFGSAASFSGPMLPFNSNHAQGSKLLLNGTTLTAGGDIQADLTAALQNIFNHPNVGPFIGKQLIQKLVTSNPSPDYVTRVAQVFNDNGSGVRGDLQAVVTAILLDPEARRGDDPTQVQPSDGHLREPLLFMMTTMRAMNATTGGANLMGIAQNMLQQPFNSPSVFNFYPPNYQLPGTQLLGPEFKILNNSTTMSRINFINSLIYGTVGTNTTTDISAYVNVAGNVNQLLDMVSTNMLHGQMPSDMRGALFSTVSAISGTKARAQAALYLVASSSQFQVEH